MILSVFAFYCFMSAADGDREELDKIGRTQWRVFSANPRAVSYFDEVRFGLSSSGRHEVKTESVPHLFDPLFPLDHENILYFDSDGGKHHIVKSNLLALLVPQRSPFYVLLNGRNLSFGLLWNATHDPKNVPIIVADEFCLDGLFEIELTDVSYGWKRPILRNYW
jgi:hypothetical protein